MAVLKSYKLKLRIKNDELAMQNIKNFDLIKGERIKHFEDISKSLKDEIGTDLKIAFELGYYDEPKVLSIHKN